MTDESLLSQATHAATKAALEQTARDLETEARVEVTPAGIEASIEVETETRAGTLSGVGFFRRTWAGAKEWGARVGLNW